MVENSRDREIEQTVSPHSFCVMDTICLPIVSIALVHYDQKISQIAVWGISTTCCSTLEVSDRPNHPLDRWSQQIIKAFVRRLNTPFDGPPYTLFVVLALVIGRCFTSPSQMLVHDIFGMMFSLGGALHFDTTAPKTPLVQINRAPNPVSRRAVQIALHKPMQPLTTMTPVIPNASPPLFMTTENQAVAHARSVLVQTRTPAQPAHRMRIFHNISVTS